MKNSFVQEIRKITKAHSPSKASSYFLKRLKKGKFTRDESPKTHYCVYFAAYDPDKRRVFVGHHIKSGLWLVNGGHIDKGETPKEALMREMEEEWGFRLKGEFEEPHFLTVTEIDNPKQTCKRHYDIWYFLSVSKDNFRPDDKKLAKEFYKIGWYSFKEAKRLVTEPNTLQAINKLEQLISTS